ncbi:aminotransferase class V-fold PLP-dependent enzyme [Alphaproteobacteria bacterium HT1-32]|nr:aminotransferase class V-fold PLP-dependent enzyme [Alphaproteobacteria bacterium HT1-32]
MNGPHFLQIPGPTNVPERILRAMSRPTIDHRGPEFGEIGRRVLSNVKTLFGTKSDVIIFPGSGTGAWEAALVNTLSEGDSVLMFETGWFATLWDRMATKLGIKTEFLSSDWRRGADASAIAERLKADKGHTIKAVCVVHNETSTGCVSPITAVRKALDDTGHPALLLVDTISSLCSIEYKHDEWGVDVTVCGSQKGMMLPPGISFNAVSAKAREAAKTAGLKRSYWDWEEMIKANATGYFPHTPATNLLYGLDEALKMLIEEEGMENVFARHKKLSEATRRCVRHWGLEIQCADENHYSDSLTAVRLPDGNSADALRATILDNFNMSLGNGLGQLADKVFRIGHLGEFNELTLIGTLGGVEMGLSMAQVPHTSGGVGAAVDYLASVAR